MRPSTAATLGKLRSPVGASAPWVNNSIMTSSYGSAFAPLSQRSHRIGGHIFGPDPAHDKYYNRTEHGTYLVRDALNQRTGGLPAWA